MSPLGLWWAPNTCHREDRRATAPAPGPCRSRQAVSLWPDKKALGLEKGTARGPPRGQPGLGARVPGDLAAASHLALSLLFAESPLSSGRVHPSVRRLPPCAPCWPLPPFCSCSRGQGALPGAGQDRDARPRPPRALLPRLRGTTLCLGWVLCLFPLLAAPGTRPLVGGGCDSPWFFLILPSGGGQAGVGLPPFVNLRP